MPNRISCRENVYGGWKKAVCYLPKAGVRYVELEGQTLHELQEAADACRLADVTPLTIGGGVDLDDEASIANAKQLCDAAGEIDVHKFFISAHGGDRNAAAKTLTALGEYAAIRGVTLCLETHPPFCRNADDMRRTMEMVDHPNVRINFDTANIMFYNKEVDSADELARIVDYVASLHLKDTDGGFHSANFPVFGEGVVPFPRIFSILHDAGFDGPLTIELEGPLLEGLDADGCHEKVVGCMSYLESIGEA